MIWCVSSYLSPPPHNCLDPPGARPLQPSTTAAAAQQQGGGGAAGGRPLLAVDMRQLKADEELRRMFGSRVVEEDEDEGGAGSRCVWCVGCCKCWVFGQEWRR